MFQLRASFSIILRMLRSLLTKHTVKRWMKNLKSNKANNRFSFWHPLKSVSLIQGSQHQRDECWLCVWVRDGNAGKWGRPAPALTKDLGWHLCLVKVTVMNIATGECVLPESQSLAMVGEFHRAGLGSCVQLEAPPDHPIHPASMRSFMSTVTCDICALWRQCKRIV